MTLTKTQVKFISSRRKNPKGKNKYTEILELLGKNKPKAGKVYDLRKAKNLRNKSLSTSARKLVEFCYGMKVEPISFAKMREGRKQNKKNYSAFRFVKA